MFDAIGEALSGLRDVFTLKRPLAADSPADEDDVLQTKRSLKDRGYYKEPDYGLTPYPDRPLFEGIRAFQKDNNLRVDGVMKPGGETERAINKTIPLPPPRKPHIQNKFTEKTIDQKAQEQGEFVGDMFAELALGRLKRMPIQNPVVRQALSKTLGVAEDIVSWLPEKVWQEIAKRQMEERQRKKRT